jgi:hypothetical protein
VTARLSPGGFWRGEIPPLKAPDDPDAVSRLGLGSGDLSLTATRSDTGLLIWRSQPAPRPPLSASLTTSVPRGYLQASEPLRVFGARKPVQLTCGNSAPWQLRQQSLSVGEGDEVTLSWADYWLDFNQCTVSLLERGKTPLSVVLRWGKLPLVLALRGPTSLTLLFPPGTRLSLPAIRNGMELESDSFVRLRIPARPGMALNLMAEIDGPRIVAWGNELDLPAEQDRAPGRANIMFDLSQTVSDPDVVLAATFTQKP